MLWLSLASSLGGLWVVNWLRRKGELRKPSNANSDCVGIDSPEAGKAEGCAGCPNQALCASGEAAKEDPFVDIVRTSLANVKKVIVVLSGKGGVGKSTVASQLAFELAELQQHTALMDVDICGPSLPRMTNTAKREVLRSKEGWIPVYVQEFLCVMSVGFLLEDADTALIWRGPKKNGLIRQFLTNVHWGTQDFLVIDTPPGTSDEHLSLITYLTSARVDGAVVVTTPEQVAVEDVRKQMVFCREVGLRVTGILENMTDSVFDSGAEAKSRVENMAKEFGVPFLGRMALSADITRACEAGQRAAVPALRALAHTLMTV